MKPLFTFLLLLLVTGSAFSQRQQRSERPNRPPVEERIKNLINTLDEELELSKEQEKSAKKIFADFFQRMQDLRKSGQRPDINQINEINKKRDTDFEALLTESQKKKYPELKEKLFSNRRRQRPNN